MSGETRSILISFVNTLSFGNIVASWSDTSGSRLLHVRQVQPDQKQIFDSFTFPANPVVGQTYTADLLITVSNPLSTARRMELLLTYMFLASGGGSSRWIPMGVFPLNQDFTYATMTNEDGVFTLHCIGLF